MGVGLRDMVLFLEFYKNIRDILRYISFLVRLKLFVFYLDGSFLIVVMLALVKERLMFLEKGLLGDLDKSTEREWLRYC